MSEVFDIVDIATDSDDTNDASHCQIQPLDEEPDIKVEMCSSTTADHSGNNHDNEGQSSKNRHCPICKKNFIHSRGCDCLRQKFTCRLCQKSFLTKLGLKSHLDNIHSQGKYYNCITCKKIMRFSSLKKFQEHTSMHRNKEKKGVTHPPSRHTKEESLEIDESNTVESVISNEVTEDLHHEIKEWKAAIGKSENESTQMEWNKSKTSSAPQVKNSKEDPSLLSPVHDDSVNKVPKKVPLQLNVLTKQFTSMIQGAPNKTLDVNVAALKLDVNKKRLNEIALVLEGLGLITRPSKKKYICQWLDTDIDDDTQPNGNIEDGVQSATHLSDNQCSLQINNDLQSQIHLENIHIEGDYYTCPVCEKNILFKTPQQFHTHVSKHVLDKEKIVLSNDTVVADNSTVVTPKLVWNCPLCMESFKEEKNVPKHIKLKHGRIVCHLCAKQFKTYGSLRQHNVMMHNNSIGYKHQCNVCADVFSQATFLQNHIKRKHKYSHIPVYNTTYKKDDLKKAVLHRKEKDSYIASKIRSNAKKIHTQEHISLKTEERNLKLISDRVETTEELTCSSSMVHEAVSVTSRMESLFTVTSNSVQSEDDLDNKDGPFLHCPLCSEIFYSERELPYHIEIKHKKLMCHICQKQFEMKLLLRYHNVNSHGNSLNYAYVCHICCYGFHSKTELMEHNIEMHPQGHCSVCKATISGNLQDYNLLQLGEENVTLCFRCQEENVPVMEVQPTDETIDTEMADIEDSSVDSNSVEENSNIIDQSQQLSSVVINVKDCNDNDEDSSDNEETWQCSQCDIEFINKEDLETHKEDHGCIELAVMDDDIITNSNNNMHSKVSHNDVKIVDVSKNQSTLVCLFCTKSYENKGQLKVHIMSQHNKHYCTICRKVFSTKPSFIYHETQIHGSSEARYFCRTCNYGFQDHSQLEEHNKGRHSKYAHFQCQQCNKKFYYSHAFERHKKIHVGTTHYFCRACNKKILFGTKHWFMKHLKYHAKCNQTEFKTVSATLTSQDKKHESNEKLISDVSRRENKEKEECQNTNRINQLSNDRSRKPSVQSGEAMITETVSDSDITDDLTDNDSPKQETIMQCSFCGKMFSSNSTLQKHEAEHADVESIISDSDVQVVMKKSTSERTNNSIEEIAENTSDGLFQKTNPKSIIWKYFGFHGNNNKDIKMPVCRHCRTEVQRVGGNTTGLFRHLKREHPRLYMEALKDRKPVMKESTTEQTSNSIQERAGNTGDGLIKKTNPKSIIWKYFGFHGNDGKDIKLPVCRHCRKEIYRVGGSTSILFYHLKTKHPILYMEALKDRKDDKATNGKIKYYCRICKKNLVFESRNYYLKHVNRHNSKLSSKVNCEKRVLKPSSQNRRQRNISTSSSKTNSRNKTDTMSESSTITDETDSSKQDEVDNKYKWNCQFCSSKYLNQFKNEEELKEHVVIYHCTERYKFMCHFCGIKFTSRSGISLREHILCQHCPICNKGFSMEHNVKEHMNQDHTSPLNLPCSHCNQRFSRNNDLKNHEALVHEKGKQYSCSGCKKNIMFRTRWEYKRHMHYHKLMESTLLIAGIKTGDIVHPVDKYYVDRVYKPDITEEETETSDETTSTESETSNDSFEFDPTSTNKYSLQHKRRLRSHSGGLPNKRVKYAYETDQSSESYRSNESDSSSTEIEQTNKETVVNFQMKRKLTITSRKKLNTKKDTMVNIEMKQQLSSMLTTKKRKFKRIVIPSDSDNSTGNDSDNAITSNSSVNKPPALHLCKWVCQICCKRRTHQSAFMCEEDLKNHVMQIHCSERYKFTCHFCGIKQTSRSHISLHDHILLQHCPICNKGFSLQQSVKEHINLEHNSNFSDSCSQCGQLFVTNNDTVDHETLFHEKGKFYKCAECKKDIMFRTNLEYLRHLLYHKLAETSEERTVNLRGTKLARKLSSLQVEGTTSVEDTVYCVRNVEGTSVEDTVDSVRNELELCKGTIITDNTIAATVTATETNTSNQSNKEITIETDKSCIEYEEISETESTFTDIELNSSNQPEKLKELRKQTNKTCDLGLEDISNNEDTLQCGTCGVECKTESDLGKHMCVYLVKKYTCHECGVMVTSEKKAQDHEEEYHDCGELYNCEVCKKEIVFSQTKYFDEHMMAHVVQMNKIAEKHYDEIIISDDEEQPAVLNADQTSEDTMDLYETQNCIQSWMCSRCKTQFECADDIDNHQCVALDIESCEKQWEPTSKYVSCEQSESSKIQKEKLLQQEINESSENQKKTLLRREISEKEREKLLQREINESCEKQRETISTHANAPYEQSETTAKQKEKPLLWKCTKCMAAYASVRELIQHTSLHNK